MHVRTFYAANSDETPTADANDGATRQSHNAQATQTLWAERPLHVHGGRLTAVRLTGEQLHVGFVPASTRCLQWVRPETIVSEPEVRALVKSTRFRR